MKYPGRIYVLCFLSGTLLATGAQIFASVLPLHGLNIVATTELVGKNHTHSRQVASADVYGISSGRFEADLVPIRANEIDQVIAVRVLALLLLVALSTLFIHSRLGRPIAALLHAIQQAAKSSELETLSLSNALKCEFKQAEATVVQLASMLQGEREARRLAEYAANHDALTHLANRRGLNEFIDRLLVAYQKSERTIESAIAFVLDLDHFKKINDTHGHSAGDALLKIVADRLQAHLRSSDIAARTGGDEFILLLTCNQVDPRDFGQKIANRISRDVSSPMQIGDKTIAVNTSIGMAIWPHDSPCIQKVLELADQNLYLAKSSSKGSLPSHLDSRMSPSAELSWG